MVADKVSTPSPEFMIPAFTESGAFVSAASLTLLGIFLAYTTTCQTNTRAVESKHLLTWILGRIYSVLTGIKYALFLAGVFIVLYLVYFFRFPSPRKNKILSDLGANPRKSRSRLVTALLFFVAFLQVSLAVYLVLLIAMFPSFGLV
jgi:hypothetical protein